MSAAALEQLRHAAFPQVDDYRFRIERVTERFARLRMPSYCERQPRGGQAARISAKLSRRQASIRAGSATAAGSVLTAIVATSR